MGQTAFEARLDIGNQFLDYTIWSERNGTLAPLAHGGMAAPGVPMGRPFVAVGGALINNSGATAFSGSLEWWNAPEFPGDVTIGNHAGIWSDRRRTVDLVMRMGDPAPAAGDGIVFDYLAGYRFNDSGDIAFLARFDHKIDGEYDETKMGIWSEGGGGGLRLIALTGAAAPGVENSSFRQLYAPLLNNQGHVVFQGILVVQPFGIDT